MAEVPVRVSDATKPGSRWSVPADALCLVAFVLGGRRSHDVTAGVGWFLEVLWPVALGWYGTALITGLYRVPTRARFGRGGRWAVTVVVGTAVTLLLRAVVQDRVLVSTFGLVLAGFLAVTTGGWRAAAAGWSVLGDRRAAGITGRGAR